MNQMLITPKLAIKDQVRDKMRGERLHEKDVALKDAVRLLVEAEDELTIDRYGFESKSTTLDRRNDGGRDCGRRDNKGA